MKKEIHNKLQEIMLKIHDELQSRPDQYIVAYYKKNDDSLIGYHLSSFCQITDDILEAKRYAGKNPTEQLKIIFENIKNVLGKEHKGMFSEILNNIKENNFNNMSVNDIYIDAIYFSAEMPKQEFRYMILSTGEESIVNINIDIDKNLN